MSKPKRIGILTAGGDSPGLNAAIRAFTKSALSHRIEVVGFRDGFRGLAEDHRVRLRSDNVAGILTVGGTILGTSRDKPHRMLMGGTLVDMTSVIARNYQKAGLDGLVCIGGGGTQKNSLRLARAGLSIVTIPKTIDGDVAMTDATIGFATALEVATEAIDRLHSTAHSHHRIIVAEVMGNRAGWLALGAGPAGGADVILIPEIPYRIESIVDAIRRRTRRGTNFSIIAVAEGARNEVDAAALQRADEKLLEARTPAEKKRAAADLAVIETRQSGNTLRLAHELEELTGLESRVSILGYIQRGGAPSSADRLLATRLGNAAADLVAARQFDVMVASSGDETRPVPLADVAGKRRIVSLEHAWVAAARNLGTCLGD